jgi:hypothetical protein
MLYTFIISFVLLLIGVFLLGFKIFFLKNGRFPNIHIGGNSALKKEGISCATTQDRDAQNSKTPKSYKSVERVKGVINEDI